MLSAKMRGVLAVLVCAVLASCFGATAEEATALLVAPFDLDVTPPVGSMMAYDPVKGTWDMGLRARGVVLLGGHGTAVNHKIKTNTNGDAIVSGCGLLRTPSVPLALSGMPEPLHPAFAKCLFHRLHKPAEGVLRRLPGHRLAQFDEGLTGAGADGYKPATIVI